MMKLILASYLYDKNVIYFEVDIIYPGTCQDEYKINILLLSQGVTLLNLLLVSTGDAFIHIPTTWYIHK